jgi:hypothetical protein
MAHYSMASLAAELSFAEAHLFLTRERGEQAFRLLADRLQEIPEGHPLVLVFPPDQLVDSSFADESIIRLGEQIIKGEFGGRCLLLEGLTEDSITNIAAAISLRRLKLAFLAVEPTGKWKCIGQLEPSLAETLDLVARRAHLTAPELAELKELAINSASNRLKRLYNQRLVWREHEISEKGLQYIYHFWEWTEGPDDQGKGQDMR